MNENKLTLSTAFDLFQHWSNVGYPDYVTGVWSTDGSGLTIGVLKNDAGEAGKQEILNLLENDTSVTFAYQTYSRNYLLQIQKELLPYFKQDELGMVGVGLSETENNIYIEILDEKTNDIALKDFVTMLQNTYGDAVSVTYTNTTPIDEIGLTIPPDGIGLTTPLSPATPGKTGLSPFFIAGLIGIPLLVVGISFILKKRFVPVIQANTGKTVAGSTTLSAKDVEKMVTGSSLAVPEGLDAKVMERIKE